MNEGEGKTSREKVGGCWWKASRFHRPEMREGQWRIWWFTVGWRNGRRYGEVGCLWFSGGWDVKRGEEEDGGGFLVVGAGDWWWFHRKMACGGRRRKEERRKNAAGSQGWPKKTK
ncbi:hypothetical protein HAX54_031888 [Datura stramonium]|uniref:Uncharacterized protein n=1 Tax=Datura stramonium TaxID=4076 RepID=A0ABS8V9V1_DATST|nr:hypothetical protein [Datura stramonium]